MNEQPIYILMLSLHGLIRSHDLELGRDADTGGQITYVVELARALGRNPGVERVDLLTRMISDPEVSSDYALLEEKLGPKVRIVRLPFGPKRYLRKELLWKHLDHLVDRCLHYLRGKEKLPDVIHTHYADAGYVGRQLSQLLGIPQVHTGHSLGRCKLQRMLDTGRKEQSLERQFNFAQRISAEEEVLSHASMIVTSTRQEAVEQYGIYKNFDMQRSIVIPPGTDASRFSPPGRRKIQDSVVQMIDRFLEEPEKPMILTICRPDARKNLQRLIAAYGEDEELQSKANLVIVAGNRDDIQTMEESQKKELSDLLFALDRYDLWGKVALPKHHQMDDVPELYRLAARRRGLFVNPALTEPFGLTLIESAASGLPIVATEDGGPRDIISNCRNGLLINPLDTESIASALKTALGNPKIWRSWARNGVNGVKRHYSWDAHVTKYLKSVSRLIHKERKRVRREHAAILHEGKSPLPLVKQALVSDIDNTLIGNQNGLNQLIAWLRENAEKIAFGIATGRNLDSAVKVLKEWRVPLPDVLITSVGSEINYGPDLRPDTGWEKHIRHQWRRDALMIALEAIPGIKLQTRENQREYKISYNVIPDMLPPLKKIYAHLRALNLHANLIYSHQAYLDVLPARASKGQAIRYLAYKWGLPLNAFLVAGDSGNDAEMMIGDTLAVIVGNHSPELKPLRGEHQVYFAEAGNALGIMEGIGNYQFGNFSGKHDRQLKHD
ncbi:HAD-IIB family hydrolase [Sulfurirhabdus autotrophica]|uniref:sucrose-phosphate synthase n=1 Tax=Sulfurirhabdus autotrophica TaxID=1706046 RepID=A0A4R3YGE8_9PROT|nr:HAD-IIB family hydrolase [Sulfurirhabdus autotrophica]TCV90298.1 sucrose-phosphate synthase [Sulfurirhabdus autotrophica]